MLRAGLSLSLSVLRRLGEGTALILASPFAYVAGCDVGPESVVGLAFR